MQALTPALNYPPELLLQAQGIRIVFFDIDGVLTDGGLYFSESGETLKRFHTLDGHGLKLLQRAGIVPAIITGRDAKPLRVRLEALGIAHARIAGNQQGYVAGAMTVRLMQGIAVEGGLLSALMAERGVTTYSKVRNWSTASRSSSRGTPG